MADRARAGTVLARFWNYLWESWALSRVYNAHVTARSESPWADTVKEVHFRAFVLEAFRDEASAAYLHDGQDLEEVKKAFIKAKLGHRTTIYSRQDTAALRNVITDMTADEAYHPEALQRYNDETDAYMQAIAAEHDRQYGKGGRHPLVTRVLRGKA